GDVSGQVEVGGRLGLLPQDPTDAVVADRIGRDVAFGPENLGLGRSETWRRVDSALAAVDLSYGRDHPTVALSGGEQQRLALAGVLALGPDLMVLDEPTSMLDHQTAQAVRDAVVSVLGSRTLVVVEHRFEPWLEHVDRVVVLDGGAVVFDGSVPDFLGGTFPELWMPGAPAPAPLDVPELLVRPDGDVVAPRADGLVVDLVTRLLRGTQRTRAVDGLSVATLAGSRLALTGPSGAGKSTALAALAGLVRPTAGRVEPDLSRVSSRELAGLLGWVPQNPEHAFVTTSIRDEVATTAGRLARPVDVDAVLDALGLGSLASTHPFRLSGGEQRRLALAAGLAHRPGLVMLDEPTVGQDRRTWAAVAGWIQAAAGSGAAVAVSTHDTALPVDVVVTLERGGDA
ncbi:MAG: ABC transporter ATP-binding protein, partial [Actinomycetales bacterium]